MAPLPAPPSAAAPASRGAAPIVRLLAALLLVLLAATTAGLGAAADEPALPDGWALTRDTGERPLPAPDAAIVVDNRYGDVRVRVHPDVTVSWLGMRQGPIDDPLGLVVRVVDASDAGTGSPLTITVERPAGLDAAALDGRRLDLTLFLPPTAPLRVTTDDGLIQVRSLRAPLVARSTSGKLALRLGGPVDAATVDGPIDLRLTTRQWSTPIRVETERAPIDLHLTPGTHANLVAETRGSITTDFSIDIERLDRDRHKRAVAVLGAGTAQLTLRSTNGAIRLVRRPHPPRSVTP
ncbi:MAG: hypothetical protein AAF772_10285 [Acidobacteriota bacterium]